MEPINLINKTCTKCYIEKSLDCFYKHIKSKDGFRSYCKDCSKKYNKQNRSWLYEKEKQYWAKNPDKAKEKNEKHYKKRLLTIKEQYKNDPEFRSKKLLQQKKSLLKYSDKYKESKKLYRKNNRSKIRDYERKKTKEDINFRLSKILRARIKDVLRNNKKLGSSVKDLGCTLGELKKYLELKFQPGMTWDNQGYYGWHIDHIKPLSSFDLTKREDFLKACHYTNLQPLWAKDNFKKSDKI